MSLSDERQRRICTTHVGSLPRPHSLSAMLFARMTGQSYDQKALADELHKAVGDIVKKQTELRSTSSATANCRRRASSITSPTG